MEPRLVLRVASFISYLVLLFDVIHCNNKANTTQAVNENRLLIKKLSPNYEFMELLFPESNFNCDGVVNITQKRGFIKSPNYPTSYQVPLFCRWNIIGTRMDEIITISFTLMDIEIPSNSPIQCYRTQEFQPALCCSRNYLRIFDKISSPTNDRLYCGDSSLRRDEYVSSSNTVTVEFNAMDNSNRARGFYLEYNIVPRQVECPPSQFLCPHSKLCIDQEKRCNGISDCSTVEQDFSDELNCTSQLCRPEKGGFLCSDGRCIPAPWSCDRTNDCTNGSDEKCLKNGVITAAIIGSLICLLLIVIAISCAIRLLALRHSGHYRSSLATATIFPPGPFPNSELSFPVPTTGDLDASLFHSVFLREPPPSYASTMGGYADVNGCTSTTYMEQYRRYRRQRRCRRMLRRQQRSQQQATTATMSSNSPGDLTGDISLNLASETVLGSLGGPSLSGLSSTSLGSPMAAGHAILRLEDSAKKPSGSQEPVLQNSVQQQQQQLVIASGPQPREPSPQSNALTIELEPIPPPLTNFDCDSQPLIR